MNRQTFCRGAKALSLVILLAELLFSQAEAPSLHHHILVFVPSYEGSQLYDPDLRSSPMDSVCVWGTTASYLSRTRYFSLRMPNPLIPQLMLQFGPIDIYNTFLKTLTEFQDQKRNFATYTLNEDLFVFPYDWRQEIATVTAPQFNRTLQEYSRIYAQKKGISPSETSFILVTHSMGGLVARTWLSQNPEMASRVAGLYLVAAPNRGSIKSIRTLVYGPDSLESVSHGFPGFLLNLIPTQVDQRVTKLTAITRPTVYELLPYDDPHWEAISLMGERHPITASSLLQSKTWEPYWPTAELEKKLFTKDWLQKRQAEGRKKINPSEWEFCQDPNFSSLKKMLHQTTAWRSQQGKLQQTAALLTYPDQATRLHLVASTGIQTPSGITTQGSHDESTASYFYDDQGDGTVPLSSVLDGFTDRSPSVKILSSIPHEKLMGNPEFLSYFLQELIHIESHQNSILKSKIKP